jgi:hypothetical protein
VSVPQPRYWVVAVVLACAMLPALARAQPSATGATGAATSLATSPSASGPSASGPGATAISDDAGALAKAALTALQAKNPDEAVLLYEAATDRGLMSATASYNRGLAYAMRIGFERPAPGDHGQAIAAFEEARLLAPGTEIAKLASSAAGKVRADALAVRTERGLDPATEPAPTLHDAVRDMLPALAYRLLAVALGLVAAFGAIMGFRREATERRFYWSMTAVSAALASLAVYFATQQHAHYTEYAFAVVTAREVKLRTEDGALPANLTPADAPSTAPTAATAASTADESATAAGPRPVNLAAKSAVMVMPEGTLVQVRKSSDSGDATVQWGRVAGTAPRTSLRILLRP